jgi:hypothetical protein
MIAARAKCYALQILASRKGRELELAELQRAEEEQRELLMKDREEREQIKKELYCMKKHNLDLMQVILHNQTLIASAV